MLIRKSRQPEIMDDFSINDNRIDIALKELKVINKYLGGNSTSQKGFIHLMYDIPGSDKINILDIGAGGSDNINVIRENRKNVQITCLDINKRSCLYIKNNRLGNYVICGDALHLPFKKSSFDIVHASLFIHHFGEVDIKNILNSCIYISKYGIVINDLQRSVFAFIGIKLLTLLFSQSKMVKNDAPLSVKRGFLKNELKNILSALDSPDFMLKSLWAFRWLIVIKKNHL